MPENSIPDTVNYLILGLVVVFVILGGFIASLITRFRSLNKDLEIIEQLKNEE